MTIRRLIVPKIKKKTCVNSRLSRSRAGRAIPVRHCCVCVRCVNTHSHILVLKKDPTREGRRRCSPYVMAYERKKPKATVAGALSALPTPVYYCGSTRRLATRIGRRWHAWTRGQPRDGSTQARHTKKASRRATMGMGNMHLPAHERLQQYAKRKQDKRAAAESEARKHELDEYSFTPTLHTAGFDYKLAQRQGEQAKLGHVDLHVARQHQGRQNQRVRDFATARADHGNANPMQYDRRPSMASHKYQG